LPKITKKHIYNYFNKTHKNANNEKTDEKFALKKSDIFSGFITFRKTLQFIPKATAAALLRLVVEKRPAAAAATGRSDPPKRLPLHGVHLFRWWRRRRLGELAAVPVRWGTRAAGVRDGRRAGFLFGLKIRCFFLMRYYASKNNLQILKKKNEFP
jgi:hypothetical protein